MIALYRIVTTKGEERVPVSEWSDDLDSLMEEALKLDHKHLLVQRVVGELEVAEVPNEADS